MVNPKLDEAKRVFAEIANRRITRGQAADIARRAHVDQADERAEKLRNVVTLAAIVVPTYRGVAGGLNTLGYKTARDGKWHASTVRRLMKRLGIEFEPFNEEALLKAQAALDVGDETGVSP